MHHRQVFCSCADDRVVVYPHMRIDTRSRRQTQLRSVVGWLFGDPYWLASSPFVRRGTVLRGCDKEQHANDERAVPWVGIRLYGRNRYCRCLGFGHPWQEF